MVLKTQPPPLPPQRRLEASVWARRLEQIPGVWLVPMSSRSRRTFSVSLTSGALAKSTVPELRVQIRLEMNSCEHQHERHHRHMKARGRKHQDVNRRDPKYRHEQQCHWLAPCCSRRPPHPKNSKQDQSKIGQEQSNFGTKASVRTVREICAETLTKTY